MPELTIHDFGAAGEGVGRLADGRVVFVPATVPGDRVDVDVRAGRGRVLFGRVRALVEPSPERVESACAVAACGGCALREASIGLQRERKRAGVLAALARIGGIDAAALLGPVQGHDEVWRYRHRVRLHAAFVDNQWRLGYHARRSNRLVPLTDCPVIWPEVLQLALALETALAPLPAGARIREVEVAYARRDGRGAAKIWIDGDLAPLRRHLGWVTGSGLAGIHLAAPGAQFRWGNLELRYDHAQADAFDLRFEPGLFTQANPGGNDLLVAAVLAALAPSPGGPVLELHAGVGNFSVPLARAGAAVTAIEQSPRAALLARRNGGAAPNPPDVVAASDHEVGPRLAVADTVLLDPPRAGAAAACAAIAAGQARRAIYVSCAPATLARDARVLVAGGMALTGLQALDMFPQTPHVEVVATFTRQR